MPELMTVAVADGAFTLDPHKGHLHDLRFREGSRWVDPLHSASVVPVSKEMALKGRRFKDRSGGRGREAIRVEAAQAPAQPSWQVDELLQSGRSAAARLSPGQAIGGATVGREMCVRLGEPLLYQTTRVTGGQGTMLLPQPPVVHMDGGGHLSFSRKCLAITAPDAPEGDAHNLRYPALSQDTARFPGVDGPVDLHRLSVQGSLADCVTLVEDPANHFGWTAVLRDREDDIVFVLRDAKVLPRVTLRFSAHARSGVLEIRDGLPGPDLAHTDCCGLGAVGRIALAPGRNHVIRHVLGAVPRPKGWRDVADIAIDQNTLRLTSDQGDTIHLPIDGTFFMTP